MRIRGVCQGKGSRQSIFQGGYLFKVSESGHEHTHDALKFKNLPEEQFFGLGPVQEYSVVPRLRAPSGVKILA